MVGRRAGHGADPDCPDCTQEDNSVRRLEVGISNPTPDVTVDETTFPHLSADERGQMQGCHGSMLDCLQIGI